MSVAIDSVLAPAGPVARAIADLGWLLIVGATVVFAIVVAAAAWALLHRGPRTATGGDADADADDADDAGADRRAAATRRWVIGGGVLFPVLVLSALLVHASLRTGALVPPPDPTALLITVKGHLWWWEARYRDPRTGDEIVTANEIRLPVGRPVRLALVSDNVIHSVWLPALAGKADLVPGRVNHLRLQADRAGEFRGPCAEYCGDQHARMVLTAIADEPADFDRWLARQAQPAAAPADAAAQRGRELFDTLRCAACHDVRGHAGGLAIGPDLTHLAGRRHLAAGTVVLTADTLAAWIADPQRIKPGARMPSYALDAPAMRALVAYLMSLR